MNSWLRRIGESTPVMAGLISQGVFAICCALMVSGAFEPAELYVYDLLTTLSAAREHKGSPIALVGAGEADLDRFGWPTSDAILADLIEKIEDGEPRAIGIDLYRNQPRPPGSDALNAAIAAHDNLFMVYKFPDASGDNLPAPAAAVERDQIGFSDMILDPDGVVRRGLLFLDDDKGNAGMSLALQLAARYLATENVCLQSDGSDENHAAFGPCSREGATTQPGVLTTMRPFRANDGAYVGADSGGYQLLADYRAGVEAFPIYSFADVLDGKIALETFKDRIVVVGVAAESVKDFFLTPLARDFANSRPLFGIELHGHLASQFLRHGLASQPTIRTFDDRVEFVLVWFGCLVGTAVGFALRSPLLFGATLGAGAAAIFGAAAYALNAFFWAPAVAPIFGWIMSAVAGTSYVSHREQRDRQAVMGLFARHVSPAVAKELWKQRDSFMNGAVPKAQRLVATVLFSDLKGFTAVSEVAAPEELLAWLNSYMDAMTDVIARHGGVIDKFIGDAIMVVFGVPLPRTSEAEISTDATAAVACAVAMSARLAELNRGWREANKPEVQMRIGIHTGPLVAGALGGKERVDYTVIGDTVNTASRLESFDKSVVDPEDPEAVGRIIISEHTRRLIGESYRTVPIGSVTVKGKQEPLTIHIVPVGQIGAA